MFLVIDQRCFKIFFFLNVYFKIGDVRIIYLCLYKLIETSVISWSTPISVNDTEVSCSAENWRGFKCFWKWLDMNIFAIERRRVQKIWLNFQKSNDWEWKNAFFNLKYYIFWGRGAHSGLKWLFSSGNFFYQRSKQLET